MKPTINIFCFALATSVVLGCATRTNREPAALGRTESRRIEDLNLGRHACVLQGAYAVTGASVSAGVGYSPIKILRDRSKGVAPAVFAPVPGSKSSLHLPELFGKLPKSVTTLFAIDLFFWDGANEPAPCDESIGNLRALIAWADRRRVNLILGNNPVETGCAARLNDEMEACRARPHCYLVDVRPVNRALRENGYVEFAGERFARADIRSDGLHLGRAGAILYAESILRELDQKPPLCETR